jgi:hypothetical protein
VCILVVGALESYRIWDQFRLARLLGALDTIVMQVKSGALQPGRDGGISVPHMFDGLIVGNRAYRSNRREDPEALFFPTDVSKRLVAGYVYCESPPRRDRWGHQWLTFNGENVMLRPIEAPQSILGAHPHWFWAEPFYS